MLISSIEWPAWLQTFSRAVSQSLNFYRVHLVVFAIVPLICSAIMWGCSTAYKIPYIDCLFCCMSAMTVTGLATIDLSTLSAFQQVLLFVQMVIGSPVFVSIIMVVVRRHFFRQAFRHVLRERDHQRSFSLSKTISRVASTGHPLSTLRRRLSTTFGRDEETHVKDDGGISDSRGRPTFSMSMFSRDTSHTSGQGGSTRSPSTNKKAKGRPKLNKDMIKRIDGGGVGLVNPMGWYDANKAASSSQNDDSDSPSPSVEASPAQGGDNEAGESHFSLQPPSAPYIAAIARQSILTESPQPLDPNLQESHPRPYANRPAEEDAFPRTRTIAFDAGDDDNTHDRIPHDHHETGNFPRTSTMRSAQENRFPRTMTNASYTPSNLARVTSRAPVDTRMRGYGGFPTPLDIGKRAFHRVFPSMSENIQKTLTMPRSNTISGTSTGNTAVDGAKEVPYISFSAVVGRNSHFQDLTEEQMEELGGVEYRALKILVWIVGCYFVFAQLAAFVVIAPYIAAGGRYSNAFTDQPQPVSSTWFSLFQCISAFSNTGMSLVDQSMIPFQTAYLMIVIMIFLVLGGNTCFPIFLRFIIWALHRLVPKNSYMRETLKFLLDHPRRCFVYLFPSTQTWVLLLVMLSLTLIDWVSFLVLDIGTPVVEAIPIGTRIAAAFLQSSAVRAAGFGIVPLNSLAPAVKVLYVIMMYISVYPVALSVRATNVYEERALGLYNEDADEDLEPNDAGPQAVAKYLGWHARRQLAFDIWWLGFALWLVCIIERGAINDEANANYFNIFNIIFEIVSAYGTVGLSLGVDYDNFSLSGSFRTLSKLVIVAVMLRGRHRGLPVAIDRAVMLPRDFTATEQEAIEERLRRNSRRESSVISDHHQEAPSSGLPQSPKSAHIHIQSDLPHRPPVESPTALHFSLPPSTLDRSRSITSPFMSGLAPVQESGHGHRLD